MSKISVIIPVYNSEKYIEGCIKSLENQTYCDFDVIFVDDGSTDSSNTIILSACRRNQNFRMIKNTGKGVSSARNYGINNADGQFITFIDSDDWVSPVFLETMMNLQEENDAQYVAVAYSSNESEIDIENVVDHDRSEVVKDNKFDILIDDVQNFEGYVWNKLYVSDVLKKHEIDFDCDILAGEDLLFNFKYLKKVDRLVCCKRKLYYYRLSTDSSVNRLENIRWFDILTVYKTIVNDNVFPKLNSMFLFKYAQIILEGIYRLKYCQDSPYTYEELRKLKKCYVRFNKNWGIKNNIKIMIFALFPSFAMAYKRRSIRG